MENLEIIKTLESVSMEFIAYKMGGEFADAVTKAVDILKKNLSVTDRWIPVTERLPDYHSDVLVLDACGCEVAWLMDDGKWSITLISDYPVTHWMPLPEPPKEV